MKTYTYDAIVVGTGAAGYNAACRLCEFGVSVAIVTEGVAMGTSRNTGSDKQTYYKLGLGGDAPDSVWGMAQNLFAGGCVDGDNALCEAALSSRSFLHLCELGVPFPVNRYGEYVGYKTDHDPYARATSAGPLTSKFMTEALQARATTLEIPVHDGLLGVEILKQDNRVCGLFAIDMANGEGVVLRAPDVILCTGGPAGIYADSVYPTCHTGSTGLALLAGAETQNLTEWQYGLASIAPRWNVSGTYMQVLPRFVSIDANGVEHEFLSEYFSNAYEALSMVFLKGYQWPFDSKKVLDGSSVIDLLVYRECVLRGRRVYLDFTKNPFDLADIDYERLSAEAYDYLRRAEATFGTPIARLQKMNAPAIELYRSKGVDIATEYLEIALCAQHNNGGIAVDLWWQTSVRGLFAAGECAGTHGITRPGGSALNAGQVGSLRAAQYVSTHPNAPVDDDAFAALAEAALARHRALSDAACQKPDNVKLLLAEAQRRMSDCAAAIRNEAPMKEALSQTLALLSSLETTVGIASPSQILHYYKLRDILVTQAAVLSSMLDYAKTVGTTRGSSLCYDKNGALREGLEECFRFTPDDGASRVSIQQTVWSGDAFVCTHRPVRPLPAGEDFFENVWRRYREDKNIY